MDISADQRQYIFKLRPSLWSDGTPLIAYNFEYAWKKILSPSFYTPFAYFFYPIKNAKAAKEGRVDINKVGIKAVDDFTLVDAASLDGVFEEYSTRGLRRAVRHVYCPRMLKPNRRVSVPKK